MADLLCAEGADRRRRGKDRRAREESGELSQLLTLAARPVTKTAKEKGVTMIGSSTQGIKTVLHPVSELIEEYGAPAEISDVTPGKVPMVPPGTEDR